MAVRQLAYDVDLGTLVTEVGIAEGPAHRVHEHVGSSELVEGLFEALREPLEAELVAVCA